MSIPWTLEGFQGERIVRISYEDSNSARCTQVKRVSAMEDPAIVTIGVYARPGTSEACERDRVAIFKDVRLASSRKGRAIAHAPIDGEK